VPVGRWAKGERTVEFVLERGRLEPIEVPDLKAQADALLQRASLREATAGKALEVGDIDGAYVAAYDAYRIGAETLLACQSLRATQGEGSHVTVEDAVSAQFGGDIAAYAKPTFERLRRTRHTAQYFDPSTPSLTRADAEWALEKARLAVAGAKALLSTTPPDRFV
jgi:hypothetical protein